MRWTGLLLLACGEAAMPIVDAGPVDAGEPKAVEIGTGITEFVALAEDDPISFEKGPQSDGRYNGYHVWLGLRASGLNPSQPSLRFKIQVEGGAVLSEGAYMPDLDGPDGELFGLRQILTDCCPAEAQRLVLSVEATDADGWRGSDSRTVLAPAECPRGLPNPTVDPCP